MSDDFADLFKKILQPKEGYAIMYGCAIKMNNENNKVCSKAGSCHHYAYCMEHVRREGFSGWEARNINA